MVSNTGAWSSTSLVTLLVPGAEIGNRVRGVVEACRDVSQAQVEIMARETGRKPPSPARPTNRRPGNLPLADRRQMFTQWRLCFSLFG